MQGRRTRNLTQGSARGRRRRFRSMACEGAAIVGVGNDAWRRWQRRPRNLQSCRAPTSRVVYTTAHGPGDQPTAFRRMEQRSAMNTCPSCSKPLQTNDLVCPHCGISLNPGTATAGPASGGGGMSVVAIIAIVIVSIVLLLGCLGLAGGAFWFFMAPVPALPTTPVSPPPPMVKKMATFPPLESLPVQESSESTAPAEESPPLERESNESTKSP